MKKFLQLLAASILMLIVLTFGKLVHSLATFLPHQRNATIHIAINEWAGYAPIIYAQILGLYKENDIAIDISKKSGNDFYAL